MKRIENNGLVFLCTTPLEIWRAETAFTKEPGTVQWLKDSIKPGDVFYDIGANIGVYTLMAAQLGATVYAFEPHLFNACSLMRNVQVNGLQDRVDVLTMALDEHTMTSSFNYQSLVAGSSGSQFDWTLGENRQPFQPVITEIKQSVALAEWLLNPAESPIDAPTVLKLDVDGRELGILRGCGCGAGLQASVRTLQVEMHPTDRASIVEWLTARGYQQTGQHFTAIGHNQIAHGADPATITDNAIFTRAA